MSLAKLIGQRLFRILCLIYSERRHSSSARRSVVCYLETKWRNRHDDTDEVFIVLDGEMSIGFRDGKVELKQGELFVVPKGVEHKPYAEKGWDT